MTTGSSGVLVRRSFGTAAIRLPPPGSRRPRRAPRSPAARPRRVPVTMKNCCRWSGGLGLLLALARRSACTFVFFGALDDAVAGAAVAGALRDRPLDDDRCRRALALRFERQGRPKKPRALEAAQAEVVFGSRAPEAAADRPAFVSLSQPGPWSSAAMARVPSCRARLGQRTAGCSRPWRSAAARACVGGGPSRSWLSSPSSPSCVRRAVVAAVVLSSWLVRRGRGRGLRPSAVPPGSLPPSTAPALATPAG